MSYFAIRQVIFWRKRNFREIFPCAKTSLLFSAELLRCRRGARGTCGTIWSSSHTKLCDLKTKLGKVGLENGTHCALRTNSNIYYSCTLPLEVYLSLWPNSKTVLSVWNSSDTKSKVDCKIVKNKSWIWDFQNQNFIRRLSKSKIDYEIVKFKSWVWDCQNKKLIMRLSK